MLSYNTRRRMVALVGLILVSLMAACNLSEPNNNNDLTPAPDATLSLAGLQETRESLLGTQVALDATLLANDSDYVSPTPSWGLDATPTPIATWEVTPTVEPASFIIHPDSDFDMEIAISELGDIRLATLVFTVRDEDGQPIEKGIVSLKDFIGVEHILIVLDGTTTETEPFLATPGIYALEVFEETADEFLWLSVWDRDMEQQILFIFEVQAGEMWDFIVTRINNG